MDQAANMSELAATLADSRRESAIAAAAMLREAAEAHRRNGELIREQAAGEARFPRPGSWACPPRRRTRSRT